MAAFDAFKSLTFQGIKIPFKTYKVKGAYRKHVHEYPHVNGGAPEKLGRSLYEVSVIYEARTGLISKKYQGTQDPFNSLGNLRALYEEGVTEDLHIPHIGTIKAFADSWGEESKNTDRSGILTEVNFIEDQESAFLVLEAVRVKTSDFADAAHKLQDFPGKSGASLWSTINNAIVSVLAIKDQADLYGSLVAAKVDGLASLLGQADATLNEFNDPSNNELLNALHNLWDATLRLKSDILQQDDFLKYYTTPVSMTVGQAAAAIYGDASKGGEIMQLNVLPDPLNIEAGTRLRYYQPKT